MHPAGSTRLSYFADAYGENKELMRFHRYRPDHVAAQFESSELVRRAVEAGGGVAFISRTAAKESLDKQKVLEFNFENVNTKRQIYLMYHKDRKLSVVSERTIEALRRYCAEKYS